MLFYIYFAANQISILITDPIAKFYLICTNLTYPIKYKPNYFNIGLVFKSEITWTSSPCSNHWQSTCKHCRWALNWLFRLGLCCCPLSFFLRNLFRLAIGGTTTNKPANEQKHFNRSIQDFKVAKSEITVHVNSND